MQTGENTVGLRKILDMTRVIALVLLFLHFYFYCYASFEQWKLEARLMDRVLQIIAMTGLFANSYITKLSALGFLIISLFGSRGRKNEKLTYRSGLLIVVLGVICYFGSNFLSRIDSTDTELIGGLYMGLTIAGFGLIMTGGARLSRVVGHSFRLNDPFDKENSGFPQEERLIVTEFSFNLPARYIYKGKARPSQINCINARRGVLIMGSPGSGKSYFIIENIIRQFAQKGFAMFVFDFKYNELTLLTYNQFLINRKRYPAATRFYSINFSDLSYSHRCNLLEPSSLEYI
jgi:hypothetical protein